MRRQELGGGCEKSRQFAQNPDAFIRCSKMCLAASKPIHVDAQFRDARELAQTSRQIARVHLNIMKLSRELASVSRQIRD